MTIDAIRDLKARVEALEHHCYGPQNQLLVQLGAERDHLKTEVERLTKQLESANQAAIRQEDAKNAALIRIGRLVGVDGKDYCTKIERERDEWKDRAERMQKAHDHQHNMAGLMLREAEENGRQRDEANALIDRLLAFVRAKPWFTEFTCPITKDMDAYRNKA